MCGYTERRCVNDLSKGRASLDELLQLVARALFIVTSKPTRDFYFLYELVDGVFKKLGKAKSPLELEEKFNIHERMRA